MRSREFLCHRHGIIRMGTLWLYEATFDVCVVDALHFCDATKCYRRALYELGIRELKE